MKYSEKIYRIMNSKAFLTTVLLLLAATNLVSQESRFFMPSEIAAAYKKGTRSMDGKPGKNYWHNTVDYKIEVAINPADKSVTGKEEVVYYNKSTETINELVVRLYNDVFKKGTNRASVVDVRDINDGVELDSVMINGILIDMENADKVERKSTLLSIQLEKPLKPGEQLKFAASWKQYVPYTNRRTGVYDNTSYFIAYWYPQISVYDDVFGWDKHEYTIHTEFYNNLANFDVKITAPENYLVWATGNLKNAEKILPKTIFEKYAKAKKSDIPIEIVDSADLKKGFKTQSNTWHYVANDVSDFAMSISDHYQWTGAKYTIDNRDVFISSAFPTEKASEYQHLTNVQQKSMKHMSEDVPGVAYPYDYFTTFIGLFGGGMEFPMMANNANAGVGLTVHEMMHTFFPMYVRTNEKRWAWMDEGWASFVDGLIENRYFKQNNDPQVLFADSRDGMSYVAGSIYDIPLITYSQNKVGSSYWYSAYSHSSHIYYILHHHLGEELFLKCFKEYINRWAKKSPTPYDFFYTFEDVSGQDLAWLWKPWFFEFAVADVAIQSLKKNKLVIENKGQKPVPIFAEITYKDETVKTISESAEVWAKGDKTITLSVPEYKNLKNIKLNKTIIDQEPMDNFYPTIKERYKEFSISDAILASFKVNHFVCKLSKKEEVIYFEIEQYNLSMPLYPTSANSFKTLDDSKSFEVLLEDGKTKSIKIEWDGYLMQGDKM